MAGDKAKKESFAIPDDEIDIRLIQQQIANALGKAPPAGKSNSDSKSDDKPKNNDPPPLIKSDSKSKDSGKEEKKEEKKPEKKELPPTIDLFGGSNLKSPLRMKPPTDGEPEIVEIEHPIPREKLTPNPQTERMVKIPFDKGEPAKGDEIKHRIPVEKLTPNIKLSPDGKEIIEQNVQLRPIPKDVEVDKNSFNAPDGSRLIPIQDFNEPVEDGAEIKHRIPVEKLTPEIQYEKSIRASKKQVVEFNYSVGKAMEEINDVNAPEYTVRASMEDGSVPIQGEEIKHRIPIENLPPEIQQEIYKKGVNNQTVQFEYSVGTPMEDINAIGTSDYSIKTPIEDDNTPVDNEIKHRIPIEKLSPNTPLEHSIKDYNDQIVEFDYSVNAPMEDIKMENTLEHSVRIPIEEVEAVNTLEHSIKEERDNKINLEHTVRVPIEEIEAVNTLEHSIPVEKLTPKIELEHSTRVPVEDEEKVNTLEHSVPIEPIEGPQLEHSKPKTINEMSKAEHPAKKVMDDIPKSTPAFNNAPPVTNIPPKKGGRSQEDSMDINELMKDVGEEISLDFLNQLTNKINSEMGYTEEAPVAPAPEPAPIAPFVLNLGGDLEKELELANYQMQTGFVDESEANINTAAAEEEQMVEEMINQEVERTVVTEQICEYPVNNMDAEYIQALDYLDGDSRYKKYVIYIDQINFEFIDSLSIQERKELINSILHEQDELRKARLREERRKKLVSILMFIILSVFVLVPLLFLVINKCMEATIVNYRRNQDNWEVLFKEHNKIKKTSGYYH